MDWKWLVVIYDIESNKRRTNLISRLEKGGLIRVQYSVFVGWVKQSHVNGFIDGIKDWIDVTNGERVMIIPCSEARMSDNMMFGQLPSMVDPLVHPERRWQTHIVL